MFSKYARQAPEAGRTVAHTLTGLRNPDGTHPVVHLERLGEENRPFWLEMLDSARADTPTPPAKSAAEVDRRRRDNRAENREIVIRHSARKLENVMKDDGSYAADADVPAFIRAIPDVDFDELLAAARSTDEYRPDPKALAEK